MKQLKFLLLCALVFFSLAGCFRSSGPWKGKIIDSETREPIEGVVVVAVWYTSHFGGPGGPVEKFGDARETLTDKDGRFEIPAYRSIYYNMDSPRFTFFKPGYGSFPVVPDRNSPDYNPRHVPDLEYDYMPALWASLAKGGGVVHLPKLKSDKERLDNLLSSSIPGAPIEKTPQYNNLVSIERKNLGLSE